MSPSKRITYEEWLTMPVVDDQTEEVVGGEIRFKPPPKWKHARIADAVARPLIRQLDRKRFMVVTASFGLIIRMSPLTSRVPDVTVFERSSLVDSGVLYLENRAYRRFGLFSEAVLAPRSYPGVQIPIAQIWPE